jgi:thymidylate synthase (FAD)
MDYKNTKIDCLDKGFVRLVDYMGDDAAIVQAARVSYGEGTKSVNEDNGLIRYLIRNKHTSPFEMVEFKFHVKLPIFVARQWIRHRTANVNEYSGRYSEMKDEFYVPQIENIRSQSKVNKQGRSDEEFSTDLAENFVQSLEGTQQFLYNEYKKYLDSQIARELARINLPLSNYTEWYWKIDLHNLFNFLRLRLDHHAQYEIRIYSEAMAQLIKPIVPLAYAAFEDYILNSVSLSSDEIKLLFKDIDFDNIQFDDNNLSKREISELKIKLESIKSLIKQ